MQYSLGYNHQKGRFYVDSEVGDRMTLGEFVKKIANDNNLAVSRLEANCGISHPTLQSIVKGTNHAIAPVLIAAIEYGVKLRIE